MNTTQELPGGLGRVQSVEDERDAQYPLRKLLPRGATLTGYKYWWAEGWWGYQGNTSRCVPFSGLHWLADSPVTHKLDNPIIDPDTLYLECRQRDEWPGEDYEGTSVRGLMKSLQDRNLIENYYWGWNLNDLIYGVLHVGPAVVGFDWFYNMFWPEDYAKWVNDRPFFRKDVIESGVAGGHAFVIDGVNTNIGFVRMKNSWGRGWGYKGFAYLHFDLVKELILRNGEVAIATERKIA